MSVLGQKESPPAWPNHADAVFANPLTPSPDLATIQTSPFPSGADGDAPNPSPIQAALDFQCIPLDQITPSKTNTRTEYAGPEFEELFTKLSPVAQEAIVRENSLVPHDNSR
jgi:hypothetical protein